MTASTRCVSDELVAAIVSGRASSASRRSAMRHSATCTSCRTLLLDQWRHRRRTTFVFPVAILLAVLSFVPLLSIVHRIRLSDPWLQLTEAISVSRFRTIEPRLRPEFSYRPLDRRTTPALPDAVFADPVTERVTQLLAGDVDGAIRSIERYLETNPGDADALTDLAIAHYERAVRQTRPVDLAAGLSAAARAIDAAPRRLEPRYVQALFLERLHLREDAALAWETYLQRDAGSPWADEARLHLHALQTKSAIPAKTVILDAVRSSDGAALRRAVESHRQPARLLAEEEFLGQWAEAFLAGDALRARNALRDARRIAQALSAAGGDRMPLDAIAAIDAAAPQRASALARGHQIFSAAREASQRARDAGVRDSLFRAAALLRDARSPLSARAQIHALAIDHYLGRSSDAKRGLLELIDATSHPLARGQALWSLGLIEQAQGFPDRALAAYAAARANLEQAPEPSNLAAIASVRAETFRYLGDTEQSWREGLAALALLDADAPFTRRQLILNDLVLASLALGHNELARIAADRAVLQAESRGEAAYTALALLARGRVAIATAEAAEARTMLDRAAAILDGTPPNGATERVIADVAIVRAELHSLDDPHAALAMIAEARRKLAELRHESRLLRLHLIAARAHLRLHDDAAAERELVDGMAVLQRQRNAVVADRDRSLFTDTSRALYEESVRLLVRQGRNGDALRVVRHARGSEAAATTAAAVEYFLLPEELLIWVSVDGATHLHRDAIDQQTWSDRIDEALASMHCHPSAQCERNLGFLHEHLFAPVQRQLRGRRDIVIAPDGVLHRVPFAALYDANARRFVAQDYDIVIALGDPIAPQARSYESILVTAVSRGDDTLPRLRYVTQEAIAAAATFPQSRTLLDGDATAERLLEGAGEFDVLHFAGHALWNDRIPGRAALRLADRDLYAYELQGRSFPQTQLVVLAACDSARGRLTGAGLLGLAQAFVAAGVPQVVGSSWPVEDEAAANFFRAYYRALAEGNSPAAALSITQRGFIAEERVSPSVWAAFQVYAGRN
jgi:CHAT domain-containing protein